MRQPRMDIPVYCKLPKVKPKLPEIDRRPVSAKKLLLINELERRADRYHMLGIVERRVCEAMDRYEASLDARRKMLNEFLPAEEKGFQLELRDTIPIIKPNPIDAMKQRIKYIHLKRETERRKLVADKLDQLFMRDCDDVRTAGVQLHAEQLQMDRAAQLRMGWQLRLQEAQEDQLYAQLAEEDRQAKQSREDAEADRRQQTTRQRRYCHEQDMQIKEERRALQRRLKQEEVQKMLQEQEKFKLEEQQEHLKMQRDKDCTHRELKRLARRKAKSLARERQQKLDSEVKNLQRLLQECADENTHQEQSKLKRRQEQLDYLRHLAAQQMEQANQQAQVDQAINADQERILASKDEQLRQKREAKRLAVQEMKEKRDLQVQQNMEENLRQRAQLALEDKKQAENAAIFWQKQLEERERLKRVNQFHQEELLKQIQDKQKAHEAMLQELQQEEQKKWLDQQNYNAKVQDAVEKLRCQYRKEVQEVCCKN